MKLSITTCLILLLLTMLICGCDTIKTVNYADLEWHISEEYGQIIDNGTAYRMTFGDVLIPENMAIVSCADSAAKYPGMDRFIAGILKAAGLEDDEVLFYSPVHGKIFVRLTHRPQARRPSSITVAMDTDRPYTMWLYDDDVEDWQRRAGEMYTYTYFDEKRQRVLIVDHYDYGTTPIAQIFVLQSRNKSTDKMTLPYKGYIWDFYKKKLENYKSDVEFWSHQIDGHRNNAIANFRIGREMQRGHSSDTNP